VDILQAPGEPEGYVVESSGPDGVSIWLGDFKAEELLGKMEELQMQKVLELARRLKPGLTLEDVRNPHDFPELSDPDWHYSDGVLAGIQSVAIALRALKSG
jgi:hypothetical protein